MTREEARQWLPLLQAYADGAEIEAKSVGENFENMTFDYTYCDGECYSVMKPDDYRIKPQDHSKCVHNAITNGGFCKNFKEKSKYGEYRDFLKKQGIDPEEMRESMASRLHRCDMCIHRSDRTRVYCATCDVRTRDKWEYKKMRAHEENPCQCVNCRHNRGEISDEYFKGYMQASFDKQSAFLRDMKELSHEPTRLTDDGTGGFLAAIMCNLDETAQILDELKGK